MRSLSATLLVADASASKTPYIYMLFTSKDGNTTYDFSMDSAAYGNRILSIQHHEEAFNDYAIVVLRDVDASLPDVTGYWTEIGYGCTTGAGDEYTGDGTNEPSTGRLWVKHQRYITAGGVLHTVLELEGMWSMLREMPMRLGSAPYYQQPYTVDTVYDIIGYVLAEYGMTVDALGTDTLADGTGTATGSPITLAQGDNTITVTVAGTFTITLTEGNTGTATTGTATITGSPVALVAGANTVTAEGTGNFVVNLVVRDGIIDTLTPPFDVNNGPFELAAGVLKRLIDMTKCYLRSKDGLAFKVVYPLTADSDEESYYTGQSYYMYYFMERTHALVPNHIYVFANRGTDGLWVSMVTGAALDQTEIDKYIDTPYMQVAAELTTQADANNRAEAILAKAKAEQNAGRCVVPHDCRVELYDRIAAYDDRQSPQQKYPTGSLTRVSGLVHYYTPARYLLEINLGGVSNTILDDMTADVTVVSGLALTTGEAARLRAYEALVAKAKMAEAAVAYAREAITPLPLDLTRLMEESRWMFERAGVWPGLFVPYKEPEPKPEPKPWYRRLGEIYIGFGKPKEPGEPEPTPPKPQAGWPKRWEEWGGEVWKKWWGKEK